MRSELFTQSQCRSFNTHTHTHTHSIFIAEWRRPANESSHATKSRQPHARANAPVETNRPLHFKHHSSTLLSTTVINSSSYQRTGSVAEWLACWTQAQKGLGSNRSPRKKLFTSDCVTKGRLRGGAWRVGVA